MRGLRGEGSSSEDGGWILISSSKKAFILDVEEPPLTCLKTERPVRPMGTGVIT